MSITVAVFQGSRKQGVGKRSFGTYEKERRRGGLRKSGENGKRKEERRKRVDHLINYRYDQYDQNQ